MRKRILVSHPIDEQTLERVRTIHDVDCISSIPHKYEETLERIGDYDALFAQNVRVDQQMIDQGARLDLISNYAVGFDNIDVAYAKEKGIAVGNIPNSTSSATAEYCMTLILNLLRKVSLNDYLIKQNILIDWTTKNHYGHSPNGKVLGILGMGRIGKILSRQARVFGMKVIYHNRRQLDQSEESQLDVRYVDQATLFSQCDVLSVNAPLTEETYHIVDATNLRLMKDTAWIVNTARGDLINHEDLIAALTSGQLAGAALDVFPQEPVVPEALKSMSNVILSPHNGTGTLEDRAAMWEETWGNIVAFYEGRPMTGRVV